MSAIQKIFRVYGPEYLERYGDRMPGIHKKAIRDIHDCRSGAFGAIVYGCGCDDTQSIACCCGNRHCPTCQQDKNEQWLQKQMEKLLPTHYFLITITLPKALREVVRSNQKTAYTALFSSAHGALKKLAKDKRFAGSANIGYLAVLHTWGGSLQYHPHLHLVIPGGVLSEKKDQWLPARQDLFVHTKPLSLIFRAKFMKAMKEQIPDHIETDLWKQDWVINSQAVGKGHNTLRYLSRYLFRVAISNHRIKKVENGSVTFLYKDRQKKRWKPMTLDAMEFIRRFLQHVLPGGFMKVRHYGFLNANARLSIKKVAELISLIHDVVMERLPDIPVVQKERNVCKKCGQVARFIAFLKPRPLCRGPG